VLKNLKAIDKKDGVMLDLYLKRVEQCPASWWRTR
jgi:hypothetical protein